MQGLGFLPGGTFSNASGVSADGSVVVGRSGSVNGIDVYIWDSLLGMRSLTDVLTDQGEDLSDWISLDFAFAVSADGRSIVGRGTNSSGNFEAFVATIDRVIEPVLLGDVNLDNTVDFSDVSQFISILAAEDFQAEADVDQSGTVDFSDISPFIKILSGS